MKKIIFSLMMSCALLASTGLMAQDNTNAKPIKKENKECTAEKKECSSEKKACTSENKEAKKSCCSSEKKTDK